MLITYIRHKRIFLDFKLDFSFVSVSFVFILFFYLFINLSFCLLIVFLFFCCCCCFFSTIALFVYLLGIK